MNKRLVAALASVSLAAAVACSAAPATPTPTSAPIATRPAGGAIQFGMSGIPVDLHVLVPPTNEAGTLAWYIGPTLVEMIWWEGSGVEQGIDSIIGALASSDTSVTDQGTLQHLDASLYSKVYRANLYGVAQSGVVLARTCGTRVMLFNILGPGLVGDVAEATLSRFGCGTWGKEGTL